MLLTIRRTFFEGSEKKQQQQQKESKNIKDKIDDSIDVRSLY